MSEENLKLWNAVCKTDPAHTKQVSYGRKFTAIDAQHQIKAATAQFGPLGEGWRYTVEYSTVQVGDHHLACADVTLLRDGAASYGPVRGCDTLYTPTPPGIDLDALIARARGALTRSDGGFNAKGFENACKIINKTLAPRIDNDAYKKATTDALTKLLSQLGFNSDVFEGKFDDNKYVAQMRDEFNPNYQKASQYLAPLRKALKEDDDLGIKELIEELKDPDSDNAAQVALWKMLSNAEQTKLREHL